MAKAGAEGIETSVFLTSSYTSSCEKTVENVKVNIKNRDVDFNMIFAF
jgi:hypothetical protein